MGAGPEMTHSPFANPNIFVFVYQDVLSRKSGLRLSGRREKTGHSPLEWEGPEAPEKEKNNIFQK